VLEPRSLAPSMDTMLAPPPPSVLSVSVDLVIWPSSLRRPGVAKVLNMFFSYSALLNLSCGMTKKEMAVLWPGEMSECHSLFSLVMEGKGRLSRG